MVGIAEGAYVGAVVGSFEGKEVDGVQVGAAVGSIVGE